MRERERHVVSGFLLLLFVLWAGFAVHRSPDFPGSLAGGIIGIAAALLMFVPLVYLVIKRVKILKRRVVHRVPMGTLLSWHIYAGIVAPILALVHSGHRFDSALGTGMTLLMLLTVISGFIGRYLYGQVSSEIREKQKLLVALQEDYGARVASGVSGQAGDVVAMAQNMGFFGSLSLFAGRARGGATPGNHVRIVQLIDAISAVEYAIKAHETIKMWFQRWLKFHILISLTLYVLITLHIAAEIYFGLRWL